MSKEPLIARGIGYGLFYLVALFIPGVLFGLSPLKGEFLVPATGPLAFGLLFVPSGLVAALGGCCVIALVLIDLRLANKLTWLFRGVVLLWILFGWVALLSVVGRASIV